MTTLEKTLTREVDDVKKEIKKLNDLEKSVKELLKVKQRAALEKSYQADSPIAEAADSRTNIQCIIDKIREFVANRQFYQLTQAIADALTQIHDHQQNFSAEILGDKVFTQIQLGLEAHSNSLSIMQEAVSNLANIDQFNEYSNTKQLETWARSLELLGEELEDNMPFFSAEVFNDLEVMCQTIVLKSRNKVLGNKNRQNRREEWRRRLRYAAGFLLNLVEMAEEDAIEEDEELIHDLLMASQSSFQNEWEGEDIH